MRLIGRTLAGLAAGALTLGSTVAFAQDAHHVGPYVAVNGNYVLNYEGNGTNAHGVGAALKLGYDISEYVAAELESGWLFYDIDRPSRAGRLLGVSVSDPGNLHIVPLLMNVIGKYPMDDFTPYAVGGAGPFFYMFTDDGPDVDIDSVGFGFKLGGGVDYMLADNMALNVESGYYFMLDPDVTTTAGGVTTSAEANTDNWYVGAGLKFLF